MKVFNTGQYSGIVRSKQAGKGIITSITCYEQGSINYARHYHHNPHLGFIIEGRSLENKKHDYYISPGTLMYYHAGEAHQAVQVIKPSLRVNLELEKSFLDEWHFREDALMTPVGNNFDIKFIMIKIFKELLANDDHTGTSIQMLSIQLADVADKNVPRQKRPYWAKLADEFIRENLQEKITLQTLSAMANVHPVTISKHFIKYFNCTFGEYIRKLKIEKALALIKSPDVNLTEVAHTCGFFDQSHFIRNFKKQTGFLPARYKTIGLK